MPHKPWSNANFFRPDNKKEMKRLKELKKQLNTLKRLHETDLYAKVSEPKGC